MERPLCRSVGGDLLNLPKRRLQRLQAWNYGKNGMYFITVCSQDRKNLFAKIINGELIINQAGRMVSEKLTEELPSCPTIMVDKFVIMPNHVHAILWVRHDEEREDGGTTRGSFPTGVSEFVQRFKTLTTRLYIDGVRDGLYPPFNKRLWQKSFYDHIIRDENDYINHCIYIDENPARWQEDDYFEQ
jgi:putative transposase